MRAVAADMQAEMNEDEMEAAEEITNGKINVDLVWRRREEQLRWWEVQIWCDQRSPKDYAHANEVGPDLTKPDKMIGFIVFDEM
ncbi:hypothetical protein M0R45_036763 [Rubus argutus]|uniref:Uncharacterized protein n=1 Tax=Rubus argutus TaxID=59490 RepID=A0AAW1VY39_RUBAR